MRHGPVMYLELVTDPGSGLEKWNFRGEDQLGSMIGMTDLFGRNLVDYAHIDNGRPVERRMLDDGRASSVVDSDADTPLPGITILNPFGPVDSATG